MPDPSELYTNVYVRGLGAEVRIILSLLTMHFSFIYHLKNTNDLILKYEQIKCYWTEKLSKLSLVNIEDHKKTGLSTVENNGISWISIFFCTVKISMLRK